MPRVGAVLPPTGENDTMSAFIVSMTTIDALVTYAIGGGPYRVTGDDPDKVGQMLVDQNYRSVEARYHEPSQIPRYRFRPYIKPLSQVDMIKLSQCYDYQACETEDYETTAAARLMKGIRSKAIRALPGYEAAPWGLPEEDRSKGGAVLLSSLARKRA